MEMLQKAFGRVTVTEMWDNWRAGKKHGGTQNTRAYNRGVPQKRDRCQPQATPVQWRH